MSGHSKWHNIQGKKGKADKARSNIFTKLARMISVTAREGGGDPTMNFSLRLSIDKAKAANMPKENIERAIKKGIGEDGGAQLEEIMYEGYGPSGVAFLVETLTDNINRTVSEVKNVISKKGGSLGAAGSVKWMFTRLGVVRLDESQKSKVQSQKSEFELDLMDAGVQDMDDNEYGLEIKCPIESFQKVLEVVKKYGLEPESSGLEWVAKEPVTLDEETSNKVSDLYDELDEMDDVKEVYTNEI